MKTVKTFFLSFLLILLFGGLIHAQEITVNPFGFFNLEDDFEAVISWNGGSGNEVLRVAENPEGLNPQNLILITEISGANNFEIEFTPVDEDFEDPGIYYGIITSADNLIFSEIFPIVIVASTPPTAVAPIDTTTSTTPVFEWTSVAGVPYYHLILTDSDFEIIEEGDSVRIEGANVILQIITPEPSYRYGDPDPSGFFTEINGDPVPLSPGIDYNYMILNNYGNNPALSSSVAGLPSDFIVDIELDITPPNLIEPEDNDAIDNDEIAFLWEPVEAVLLYEVKVFQEIDIQGSIVSALIWSNSTAGTSLTMPANTLLVRSRYLWAVRAIDDEGASVQSETRSFNYEIETGTIHFVSMQENRRLPRVDLELIPITGSSNIVSIFTDDGGSFDSDVAAGIYEVIGHKDGYQDSDPVQVEIGDLETITATIVLQRFPSMVDGTIFDETTNEAISGATVIATSYSGDVVETEADLNGIFNIGLAEGSWILTSEKLGYTPLAPNTIDVPTDLSQTLFMTPNDISIQGSVVNTNGAPVGNAWITLVSEILDLETRSSNEEGFFSFLISPGVYTLSVEKTGFISPPARIIEVEAGLEAFFVDPPLELTPDANLALGFVTNGTAPIADVLVTATPTSGTPSEDETNGNGQFSFNLVNGTYEIVAEKEGYQSSDVLVITLSGGDEMSDIELVLTPNPSIINGLVTTVDQQPLAEATIYAADFQTQTELDGSYTLSVQPGNYEVFAAKEGFLGNETTLVSITVGETLSEVDFVLSADASVIRGSVINEETLQPVANANVTALFLESGTIMMTTQTDGDGNYSFSLDAGEWRVYADKAGFVTAPDFVSVNIAAGQTSDGNDFRLTRNVGILSGRVQSGGQNLRNASVLAVLDPNNIFNTVTGNEGDYQIEVTAGEYTISVSKEGFSFGTASEINVELSQETVQDFNLIELESSISGQVNDLDNGEYLNDVTIFAAREGEGMGQSVNSDIAGRYQTFLDSGTYDLVVSKLGYANSLSTNVVGPGEDVIQNFTLEKRAATLVGRVTENDLALQDAVVTVTPEHSELAIGGTATTNASGYYTIDNILIAYGQIANFNVTVVKDGFSIESTEVDLEQSSQETLDFTATIRTSRIEGTITSTGGGLLQDVVVKALLDGQNVGTELTTSDGFYAFDNLDAGTYQVSAFKQGFSSSISASFDLALDQTETKNLSLSPNNGTIEGTVAEDGNLLSGVSIYLNDDFGHSGSATTDENGYFIVTSLATEELYHLTASKFGYETATQSEIDTGSNLQLSLVKNFGSVAVELASDESVAALTVKFINTETGTSYEFTQDTGTVPYNDIPPSTSPYAITVSKIDDPDQIFVSDPPQISLVHLPGEEDGVTFNLLRFEIDRLSIDSDIVSLLNSESVTFSAKVEQSGQPADETTNRTLSNFPVQWSTIPDDNTITSEGLFTPNERFLGRAKIIASIPELNLEAESEINILAPIRSTTNQSFTNFDDLELAIPSESINTRKEIKLTNPTLANMKMFRQDFRINGKSYRLEDVTGQGDEFEKNITLTLPIVDKYKSNELYLVARWDIEDLMWTEIEASTISGEQITVQVPRLGEYAVFVRSEALAIHDLTFLPSPFSPEKGSMKIGFELTSTIGQAFINVEIFNMRGDKVRTLCENQLLHSGIHGSNLVGSEPPYDNILWWNGLANSGKKARNGRYVVRVEATEDGGDTVTEYKTCVLVK